MQNSELIKIEEFSKQEGISEGKIIENIRDGVYSGQLINDHWFIEQSNDNTSSLSSSSNNSIADICFNLSGKISIKEFWVQGTLLPWTIFIVIFVLGTALRDKSEMLGVSLMLIPMIIMQWISIATVIKRLHDRGITRWWYLLYGLPIIGVPTILYMCSLNRNSKAN